MLAQKRSMADGVWAYPAQGLVQNFRERRIDSKGLPHHWQVSSIMFEHRHDCSFGSGAYRIEIVGGTPRYCQTEDEVQRVHALLPTGSIERVLRDGYCLDNEVPFGDANTPDVVDAEQWLGWPRERAMREVGLQSETDYRRVYEQVEAAVSRRNDRESQGGVHASIVIKRRGRALIDVLAEEA